MSNEPMPDWPPPSAAPIDPAPVGTPPRMFTPTAEVEALLDASFEAAHLQRCYRCGALTDGKTAACHPCRTGNRARGPLYGGSLAGHQATVVYTGQAEPLPYPLDDAEPAPCAECAVLRVQVAALQAQCGQLAEAQAAAVRAGKRGMAE